MSIVVAPRASAILYNLLKSGDHVYPWLLPANICPIVPITFLKAGVPFELVDISAKTRHMDQEQAEAEIEKRRVGGILYAHTYGEASTPSEFFAHLKELDPSIIIVDDRCLCLPDLQPEVDSAADLKLFSTGYAKVAELGWGGYAVLRTELTYETSHLQYDAHAHEQVEVLYKQALLNRTIFQYRDSAWLQTDGDIPRWDEYRQQIEANLAESLAHRLKLNEIYTRHLPPEIQLPEAYQYWRFNICVTNRQPILDAIFNAGLFASSHYASLAGVMANGRCPEAEKLHAGIINLFNDHHFDEQKAREICQIIVAQLA